MSITKLLKLNRKTTCIYKVFGLVVESELECPDLPLSSGIPDVRISFGKVPDSLESPLSKGVRFQAAPGEFLLKVDLVAHYHVKNGDSITIQPFPNSNDEDIRLFMLGSAFGALIMQRGLLPFHGSGIVIDNNGIIFSGVSGSGKSTLAGAFLQKGYSLITDDVSVIEIREKTPFIHPGYPRMKLWKDSLKKLEQYDENLPRVRKMLEKYRIDVTSKFVNEKVPLTTIYILNASNKEGIELKRLRGIEKFNALKNNTYRYNFIRGLQQEKLHFMYLSDIAGKLQVKKITRTNRSFMIDELRDLILKDIKNNG